MHMSFPWQDICQEAQTVQIAVQKKWKSVPETFQYFLLQVKAAEAAAAATAAASAAGLIMFWWPVGVHCLRRCQKPCSQLFCTISLEGVQGGHFTSSQPLMTAACLSAAVFYNRCRLRKMESLCILSEQNLSSLTLLIWPPKMESTNKETQLKIVNYTSLCTFC